MKYSSLANLIGILICINFSLNYGVLGLNSGTFDDFSDFLEEKINMEFLPQSKAIGLGITVVHQNGTILFNNGFGYRDLESNSLVNDQTLFPIASITKSFTATLAVKTLNEIFPELGEQVLDIPIRTLFPSLNFTLNDRYRTESTSFKDLLSHRSCESSQTYKEFFGAVTTSKDYTYKTRYEHEVCPFRSTFVYNNAFYALAGQLIAEISGDTFENIARNLLDQIGMTESKLVNMDEDYDTLPNMVQGCYEDQVGIKKYNSKLLRTIAAGNPNGGLICSTTDMGKYLLFHMNAGYVNGQQVVPQEVMKWLINPAIHISDGVNYGLGFELLHTGDPEPFITHGGYWPPYASRFSIHPALKIGIFCSTNGPGSSTPSTAQSILHNDILTYFIQNTRSTDRPLWPLKGFPMTPSSNELLGISRESAKKKVGVLECTSDNAIIGHFGHPVEGQVEILNEAGTLKISYGIWGMGDLVKLEECKFEIEWTTDVVAVFYTYNNDGYNVSNILEFSNDNILQWTTFPTDVIEFQRDLNEEDLPEIPFDPDSCVAENRIKKEL